MASKKGHFGDASFDELHLVADSTDAEDQACLTGHLSSFAEFANKRSCNYRWQCYEGNEADSSITERLHGYPTVAQDDVETDQNVSNPKDWLIQYCFSLPAPREEDWHIGGPKQPIQRKTFRVFQTTVPAGKNFTKALWPYFNNAHHIIPKGTLQKSIKQLGSDLSDIVQKALLKAHYNVNHKTNMIFLPMDKRVGSLVRLPRHLERRALRSHPVYDDYVKAEKKLETDEDKGLKRIMNEFKKAAKQAQDAAGDDHPIPDADLSKKKLEKLSRTLLKDILDWGAVGTGASLDEEAGA